MKYASLLVILACASIYAMNNDDQEDPASAIIKHDLGNYTAKSVAFSNDGKRMVVAFQDTYELYHLDTNEKEPTFVSKRTFDNQILDVAMIPHRDHIKTRFSDTDDIAISNGTDTASERVHTGWWDKSNSRGDYLRMKRGCMIVYCYGDDTEFKLEAEEFFNGDAHLDENSHVIARSGNRIQVWNYKSRANILDTEFINNIHDICLSPDGDKLYVSLSSKPMKGHGEVWDTKTSKKLYDLPYTHWVRFVDDRLLAINITNYIGHCSGDITVIDAYTGRTLKQLSQIRVLSCVFSSNNKYFAQVDQGIVSVYDADANLLASVDSQGQVDKINAISPEGDSLVVTTRENKTSLWNLANLIHKKSKC